ncbi:MAG: cytochrome b5-like heme/steroid binding domain-containing protein [Kibdelosporangium sp.]
MEPIREEFVLERADPSNPLVILDGKVVDLSDFLERHPGGPAVMLANLGRDVSADFHHVPAHSRHGVVQTVGKRVVAEVDRAVAAPATEVVRLLLGYIRLVLNSFATQLDAERDATRNLVYVGQLYCHLVGDHLRSFLNALDELLGTQTDPEITEALDRIFEVAPALVEEVIISADDLTAVDLAAHMQERCIALLRDLLSIGADAVGALRATEHENSFSPHLEKAVAAIKGWTHGELCFVIGR